MVVVQRANLTPRVSQPSSLGKTVGVGTEYQQNERVELHRQGDTGRGVGSET